MKKKERERISITVVYCVCTRRVAVVEEPVRSARHNDPVSLLCHFAIADQIEHKKHAMESSLSVPARQPTHRNAPSPTSPKFARGAGPHVDDYMRMEMDVKKRKEMEHRVSANVVRGHVSVV